MAKTKAERIASIEEEIKQLANKRKTLAQKQKSDERKARTKRLCSRHGLFESMLPDTIPLSEEQFKMFLEKTVCNDFGRRMLAGITAQNTTTTAPEPTEAVAQGTTAPAAKTPQKARESGTDDGADMGNGTRVSG